MVRSQIKQKLIRALKKSFGDSIVMPDFSVDVPENPEHGDYATNIALILGKKLGKSSLEVAKELSADLASPNWMVSVADPGFLNFKISAHCLKKEFNEILKRKKRYGSLLAKKEKIQVEFISANPTGPLTLASGRGGFLGEALANVLEFSGRRVEREYYINDTGNQILTFGKSLLASVGVIRQEENFYKGAYVKKWAVKNRALIRKYSNDPMGLGRRAARDFLAETKNVIKKAGIRFDRFTSEYALHQNTFVKKAFLRFRRSGKVYQKDGAWWLKTSEFGDDKDRVLITSDAFPTYFLSDAGHYLETKTRGFDAKINILGPDHYGYVKRIQAAASMLGLKKSETIVTQAVRLIEGGKEVKMSRRRGEFITFVELLKEVPIDAVRYFFLEKSPDTHIDFDLNLAKEQSVKNPVYYIQYAYVRCRGILREIQNPKSAAEGEPRHRREIQNKFKIKNSQILNSPEETALIKKLIQFPEIVEDTARDYQVHRLPRYAYELAHNFHNFYEKHRVIIDDQELTAARLMLVKASQIVLQNIFKMLGISMPNKM